VAHTILEISFVTLFFAVAVLLSVGVTSTRATGVLSRVCLGLSLVTFIGYFLGVFGAKIKFSSDFNPLLFLAIALLTIGQVLQRIAMERRLALLEQANAAAEKYLAKYGSSRPDEPV